MTIFFDLKLYQQNKIYEKGFFAMFRAKQTKFEPLDARVSKTLKKPQKRNLARNFKQMTIVFDYNHFNSITYTI